MATLRSKKIEQVTVSQVEFSNEDIAIFEQCSADPKFKRSMAMTLFAVGSVGDWKETRQVVKLKYKRALAHLKKTGLLIKDLPIHHQLNLSVPLAAIDQLSDYFSGVISTLFPSHNPIDICSRRVLHGVAYQFRKRNIPVTVNDEPPSMFIAVASILLAARGKVISASTVKMHALQAGLPSAPPDVPTFASEMGYAGIALSEGVFPKIVEQSVKLQCSEYMAENGGVGYQFVRKHLAPDVNRS